MLRNHCCLLLSLLRAWNIAGAQRSIWLNEEMHGTQLTEHPVLERVALRHPREAHLLSSRAIHPGVVLTLERGSFHLTMLPPYRVAPGPRKEDTWTDGRTDG